MPNRVWSRPRWLAVGVVAVVAATVAVLVLTSHHATATGPRALTTDEAGRLAITRFRNYQAGGRAVTISVPDASGELTVIGSVDYRARTGYGVVHGTGRDAASTGLIEWTTTAVFFLPQATAPATAPDTPPPAGWYQRQLSTAGSSLDSSLAITLGLGSDRPDNAELLPQNGATWLGQDTVAGHPVDIMTGPNATTTQSSTVRYWIGADGTMYRVQASVSSGPQPVIVDFDTQRYLPVHPIPGG